MESECNAAGRHRWKRWCRR